MVGFQLENSVQHNSAIGAADCRPCFGTISQGVTSLTRLGDKITPKSLRLRGTVSFMPDTCTTSQNIYVRIIIASQKNIKVGSSITGGVDTNHLLRPNFTGVGQDQIAFAGNTRELDYPINKDLYRVYMDKTIKLTSSVVTGGGVEQMPMYSARYSYKFKSLPSSLTFDAANGDWANNFAPFIAVGYAYSDGTGPDVLQTRVVSNIASFLEFEDA